MAKGSNRWRKEPSRGDFEAAAAYLSLVLPVSAVKTVIARLKRATTFLAKAKDLERASGLKLLSRDEPDVAVQIKKVEKGKPMAPILLVRGSFEMGRPLLVADGYHRICASYELDPDAGIPCRLVDPP